MCLFLLAGGWFQLGTTVVLAAVGVPPHFGGRGYLDTSVGVDAPTLAPLSMAGHVALLQVVLSCFVTVGELQVIKIFQRSLVVMERHSRDALQNSVQLLLTLALSGVRCFGIILGAVHFGLLVVEMLLHSDFLDVLVVVFFARLFHWRGPRAI